VSAIEIVVPALINGILTVLVLAASLRRLLAGIVSGLVILTVLVAVSWLWPSSGGPSRHSAGAVFGTYLAIIAFTWLPGAALAVIAGRLSGGRRAVLGTVSICVGLLLGAAFVVTGLSFVCGLLGDCL